MNDFLPWSRCAPAMHKKNRNATLQSFLGRSLSEAESRNVGEWKAKGEQEFANPCRSERPQKLCITQPNQFERKNLRTIHTIYRSIPQLHQQLGVAARFVSSGRRLKKRFSSKFKKNRHRFPKNRDMGRFRARTGSARSKQRWVHRYCHRE